MNHSYHSSSVQLGVCYYPEHWPETLWPDDFRRMRDLGLTHVRLAEFGWALMEPAEGEFDFSLYDRALAQAHEHGLKVILGTPTATPPAWLTMKYPEVLNASQSGVVYQHGVRRHYNYNAPIYRDLCGRIVRKMVNHYKDHPAVVGWQIDNELNCETNVFYSAADHLAFRNWLRQKYGSLEKLNDAWGAVFWSQTYTDWDQVHLTRPAVSDGPNPHQALDEKRFFSHSTISFARIQSEIIRELAPAHWITTNGLFGHLDNNRLTSEALDFISFDSYPLFNVIYPDDGDGHPFLDRCSSLNVTRVRGLSPNFVIMEQQSGPGGWVNRMHQPAPKPGQMRLWTYQSIAHGADLVVYFRWRTAAFGTEIYWHGLNNHDNRPNRRLDEARVIATELAEIGQVIAGTKNVKQVAFLKDYDNEWDGELDGWHGPFDSASTLAWFKALQRRHIQHDLVYTRPDLTVDDLKPYSVVIAAHFTVMTEETAQLLTDYVRQGGTVVFGCRTGYKDVNGHCRMSAVPGPVAELCGVVVDDFTMVSPIDETPKLSSEMFGLDAGPPALAFNEILTPVGNTETLATYDGSYYAGKTALTRNAVGDGAAYYYGAVFNVELAEALIEHIGVLPVTSDWLRVPEDVELTVREDATTGRRLHFLLNYTTEEQEIEITGTATDLLTGSAVSGTAAMAPYAVMILERPGG